MRFKKPYFDLCSCCGGSPSAVLSSSSISTSPLLPHPSEDQAIAGNNQRRSRIRLWSLDSEWRPSLPAIPEDGSNNGKGIAVRAEGRESVKEGDRRFGRKRWISFRSKSRRRGDRALLADRDSKWEALMATAAFSPAPFVF